MPGKTYYVDAWNGSDGNNGLSPGSAFKSIAQVNKLALSPGDQVLFHRGDTFAGSLKPKAAGKADSPVTFGAYGSGSDPVIRAGSGAEGADIRVDHIVLTDHGFTGSHTGIYPTLGNATGRAK